MQRNPTKWSKLTVTSQNHQSRSVNAWGVSLHFVCRFSSILSPALCLRGTYTFNLRFSPKNPTSFSELLLTRLTRTASFSRPWKPSTDPNSMPGKASFIERDISASCIYVSIDSCHFWSMHKCNIKCYVACKCTSMNACWTEDIIDVLGA